MQNGTPRSPGALQRHSELELLLRSSTGSRVHSAADRAPPSSPDSQVLWGEETPAEKIRLLAPAHVYVGGTGVTVLVELPQEMNTNTSQPCQPCERPPWQGMSSPGPNPQIKAAFTTRG